MDVSKVKDIEDASGFQHLGIFLRSKQNQRYKGYQTPQKVVSSSYLDLKYRAFSFFPLSHHSTALNKNTIRLKYVIEAACIYNNKPIIHCFTRCDIDAVSVFLQSPNLLLQFALHGVKEQQFLTLHTGTKQQHKISNSRQLDPVKDKVIEIICVFFNLPVLACSLDFTIILVLNRLQTQLSVDT